MSNDPREQELKRRVNAAMTALRDAEDYARLEMPRFYDNAAERIREVHEKLTKDVLEGSTRRPTPREQLRAFQEAIAK